jgi:hypothetical protein
LQTFAIVRYRPWFLEFTTYALGKPPESKLDGGEGNGVAQGYGKVLEVLDESGRRPNQESVRSTTHRAAGRQRPFCRRFA